MSKTKKIVKGSIAILLLLLAMASDILALNIFFNGGAFPIGNWHLAAIGFTAFALIFTGSQIQAVLFRVVLVFLLPGFGLVLVAITYIPWRIAKDDNVIKLYDRYKLFEKEGYQVDRVFLTKKGIDALTDISPLQDVLSSSDEENKMKAIRKLSYLHERKSIEILGQALTDGKQNIKTLAASAIGRIDEYFATRTKPKPGSKKTRTTLNNTA